MTKETAGKIATDLLVKEPESRDPIEIQREAQKDYVDTLIKTTQEAKKTYHGDFFIVVLTKNEKLLPNVFRNYFFPRFSCPSPDYDQSVFWYNSEIEEIHYIWTIPSQEASHYLKNNALQVTEEEKPLLNFVLQFDDGTLYKLCKKLNREQETTPLLEN